MIASRRRSSYDLGKNENVIPVGVKAGVNMKAIFLLGIMV